MIIMSDNIFEGLDEYLPMDDNIFKDKKPLDHRFLPDNLPHRKEQITAIARYWVEALKGTTPSNITIYGKTGTGKTAAAKLPPNTPDIALKTQPKGLLIMLNSPFIYTPIHSNKMVIFKLMFFLWYGVVPTLAKGIAS